MFSHNDPTYVTEETLTDRARSAETLARSAEAQRINLSENVDVLTGKIAELEFQVNSTTAKLHEASAQLKNSEVAEVEAVSRATVLEQELHESRESSRRLAKETKAMETKLKLQLQDAKDALLVVKGDYEDEKSSLQSNLEALRKELADMARRPRSSSAKGLSSSSTSNNHNNHFSDHSHSPLPFPSSRPVELLSQSSILERSISSSTSGEGSTPVPPDSRGSSGSATFSFGANGEVSVLAVEKLQQAYKQKEQEVIHLQERLLDVSIHT